ncbi:helicase-like transcription factor CHR28 [Andrographis paniculata]|uniref:helicase-like transcription factor CHR28 n=1 Tax=Andrographis paniculata TaxID=175694 RepID=UPI0021E99C03|nr:helicase-like transcription factor CHR28 [Andrographis paniculata]
MMMVDRDEGSSSAFVFDAEDDADDVLLDVDSLIGTWGVPPGASQQEGNMAEDLPPVDGLKEMQTSTDMLPGSDFSYLPNNSEALVSTGGYLDGFLESDWNYGVPASQKIETSSQSQSNDLYYGYGHNGSLNASSSYQNEDSHGKTLFKGTNIGSSFTQMENSAAIDGDKISFDVSNTESSSGDIAGADISDMLSENSDMSLFHSEDQPYFPGYSSLGYSDDIFDSHLKYLPLTKEEIEEKNSDFRMNRLPFIAGETHNNNSTFVAPDCYPELRVSEQKGLVALPPFKGNISSLQLENEIPKFSNLFHAKYTQNKVQNSTRTEIDVEDDSDLCILEDRSTPARPNHGMSIKPAISSHHLPSRVPTSQVAVSSRFKPNDERVIFQVALQDLSQPKLEATLPDGLLSVSLLKHQRIALSWMVNKETRGGCCSGGILADDQGLGKTISTIALLLKERSPSSKTPERNEKQVKTEMLNLDEDDDGAEETLARIEGPESHPLNALPANGGKASVQANGRPSGGTLIVCPTSVLRQWADELQNKVSRSAKLSVLVYYGSSRTKDPYELAQHDVVITTYAIVSMEVPKQPVVNENEDQIGSSYKEFSSSKKRKLNETTGKRSSKKSKNGVDNELLENISGPLAKVGWFRVVLDEAQSIKNHRTQVARACWGLRAKRRWCLSGTPIQNAIDDLYSYFRFLRHEPYSVFKTFCEQIKVPVHKNPKTGYKKLQAVLKTIMLRRTKGTILDGKPIINLPPKTVDLKKIDFSKEERDFYCRLEAESRAQFAEYAAAGTVKQNYVNILLMLLRLRQACDHPLLVKGFNSNSNLNQSIEAAKQLPHEKKVYLVNCLEASLAICGICKDSPEDAVVTVCGHVFCNQCICEQMIGADSQCPSKKCRKNLAKSSVFSIIALRTALSEQPSIENNVKSEPDATQLSEPQSLMCPQDSSKIKAALHILLTLCGPQDCTTKTKDDLSDDAEKVRTSENNGALDVKSESAKGQKAIVFSQWTGMLDLLEACLKTSAIQYRRLDGTMSVSSRDRAVKDFNTIPQVSVMIMSLKAASLGLNMVAACNVILLDLWWNPTTEDQAVDRAHRIGQVRPVSVFRLTVKDTVEDRILALQQRKREMVASAFGEDETGSRQTRLTVEDLKYLFRV